jgi:prepilin-type N-terminal cleavage/methylation domain-containing protein
MIRRTFKKIAERQAGFTLYELLITIGVVTIVMGIVLFNQSKFRTDIEVTNLAYRLALAVREAQVYSISVKQFGAGQNFDIPYGVHFNRDVPDAYILFADADGNGMYNYPSFDDGDNPENGEDMECENETGSECVQKTVIGRGNQIAGWCGILLSAEDPQECSLVGVASPDENSEPFQFLDIRFRRPNPDAMFKSYENGEYYEDDTHSTPGCLDNGGDPTPCDGWAICVVSPHAKRKQIVVYTTGQISVEEVDEDSYCPHE